MSRGRNGRATPRLAHHSWTLRGAGSLVKINYTLSKRLSLLAQAGTAPAVDLFYTFSFD